MKKLFVIVLCLFLINVLFLKAGNERECGDSNYPQKENLSVQNLLRAMAITDSAVSAHFIGNDMAMARFYNPYTEVRSKELGSIWMYTSAIEAVNAILHGLIAHRDYGNAKLFHEHFNRYSELLYRLYDNADYYLGTFKLTSYTQSREWSVYGVNRGVFKGTAKVEKIQNVYDDQMWLIRELILAYKITGKVEYLEKAEYLTDYVLDGWDCTRDQSGEERGGITWGPGYVTKHACSNGPMISPLVWLYEIYKDKNDEVTYLYIDPVDKQTRKSVQVKKCDYYLGFAKKIYDWQKKHLLRPDGVYDDMMGGCTPGSPQTEIVNGVVYRQGISCKDRVGPAITYNSGTMLSGAADLYKATGEKNFLEDARKLSDASFHYFAKQEVTLTGYYTYDLSGFRNWFNGVLLRGYLDVYPFYESVSEYIQSFQQNLDYGYDHFLYKGFLPANLLEGWRSDPNKNQIEGMFSFAFAAEYAGLASYGLGKGN
ncbi:glycoside hydrolase family 76 protein [Thermophagus sp. OGC60D27]|uniref:glycoside hydrolase family 76 protein n=1 Tax=Thermophagus sp. OGC60D27 TaxID=3458415 RepID=UPI00403806CA